MGSRTARVAVKKQGKHCYDPEGVFAGLAEALQQGGVGGWNRKKGRLEASASAEDLRNGFADADLSGLNLSGINLSGMVLKGCDFSGATLEKADFRGARLWQAGFDGANQAAAKFSTLADDARLQCVDC